MIFLNLWWLLVCLIINVVWWKDGLKSNENWKNFCIEIIDEMTDKMKGMGAFDMTGNEYQQLASRTINQNISKKDQEFHALHGMVGEIGELHSIYQKKYQGHVEETDEHRKKELGDLLWFVAEYCSACGWTLEDVMQMNIDKLLARYPEGFDAEHSLHREEGDI